MNFHEEEEVPSSQSKYAKEGQTLMTRTLLNDNSEPMQGKKFFKTRCKCKGKVCNIIVDSKSTDNLVLEEIVKKLKLGRIRHPNPYWIACVKNTQKLLVNEKCNVKFKVGNYSDEILCDIILMDSCHIFLGRPWQYDRKAIHDGCANTYTVFKGGVNHKLKPLKEENVHCGNSRVCLVDSRKFLDGMKHEKFCFVIIYKTNKYVSEEVTTEVANLLQEFQDIVSDNALKGLLSLTKISHQLDLIPGASLPNKVAHRMSPTKSEELTR